MEVQFRNVVTAFEASVGRQSPTVDASGAFRAVLLNRDPTFLSGDWL
jgi:hypothetical protein